MKCVLSVCFTLCIAILGTAPLFASQNVDEVIKLTKSGVSADVLVAFVDKSNGDLSLSADDLVAMNDAGVPATVIEEMLRREKEAPAGAGEAAVAADVTVAPSADNADVSLFYSSMSNDGTWANDPEYGWSWQPRIAHGDENWRPYVDNGSWVYTDDGWYWNSGYSWGWAAFHYGRWSHRENNWYWHPDNVWGSSWVSWRNNDSYYGWAPLTPRARYGSGGFAVGLTTGNFDLNIGLGERDYCFVHSNNFLEINLNRHQIARNEVTNIYRNSTVVNNYSSAGNNRVSNHGIPVRSVALATKQDIKPVSIVDNSAKAGQAVHAGAIQNGKLEVFRPTLAAKASLDPAAAIARHPAVANRAPVANERDSAKKAELIKHVNERAATEPKLKPRATDTTRHSVDESKTVNTPNHTPETRTPAAERTPNRVPETHDNTRPETSRPEIPKAHDNTRTETTRPEIPKPHDNTRAETPHPEVREPRDNTRAETPRPEPKQREEQPRRQEAPARSEKSEKNEK